VRRDVHSGSSDSRLVPVCGGEKKTRKRCESITGDSSPSRLFPDPFLPSSPWRYSGNLPTACESTLNNAPRDLLHCRQPSRQQTPRVRVSLAVLLPLQTLLKAQKRDEMEERLCATLCCMSSSWFCFFMGSDHPDCRHSQDPSLCFFEFLDIVVTQSNCFLLLT